MSLAEPDRSALRTALEQLARELEAALDGSAEAARPVELDQPALGRVSRIDAIQQQKMLEASRAAQRVRLDRVRAALRRCDAGEYGACLACGEEIDPARLRARPESSLCIECQRERERG